MSGSPACLKNIEVCVDKHAGHVGSQSVVNPIGDPLAASRVLSRFTPLTLRPSAERCAQESAGPVWAYGTGYSRAGDAPRALAVVCSVLHASTDSSHRARTCRCDPASSRASCAPSVTASLRSTASDLTVQSSSSPPRFLSPSASRLAPSS